MIAYYSEIDPYAAQWLRNLIGAGHIAAGIVDERSIEDVEPEFLKQFTQCHFFAGIGVWSHALRRSGWPDDRPVWTGSCPCQPFSAAGKGAGTTDERHLWPAWHHLIDQCRPPVIFGEQVEAAIKHGWLDLVQDDLEGSGYAFGSACVPAAGVGAPHIRSRLWFVADAAKQGLEGAGGEVIQNGSSVRLAEYGEPLDPAPTNGFWRDADWLRCRDDKWRPVEPSLEPLANGSPSRVGRLRAYGNAICAPVAEEFIRSYLM